MRPGEAQADLRCRHEALTPQVLRSLPETQERPAHLAPLQGRAGRWPPWGWGGQGKSQPREADGQTGSGVPKSPAHRDRLLEGTVSLLPSLSSCLPHWSYQRPLRLPTSSASRVAGPPMSPLPPSQLMLPHRPGWKHRAGPQGLQTPLTLSPRREPAGGAGLTDSASLPQPRPLGNKWALWIPEVASWGSTPLTPLRTQPRWPEGAGLVQGHAERSHHAQTPSPVHSPLCYTAPWPPCDHHPSGI